jgi:hypothetical protein
MDASLDASNDRVALNVASRALLGQGPVAGFRRRDFFSSVHNGERRHAESTPRMQPHTHRAQAKKNACTGEGMRVRSTRPRYAWPFERGTLMRDARNAAAGKKPNALAGAEDLAG